MKQVITSILGLLLASLCAQAAPTLTEAQRDWLHRHGKLVFVADTDYPPYTLLGADGQPRVEELLRTDRSDHGIAKICHERFEPECPRL